MGVTYSSWLTWTWHLAFCFVFFKGTQRFSSLHPALSIDWCGGPRINPCWLPGVIKWVNERVSLERWPHLIRGEQAFLHFMRAYNRVTPIWERLSDFRAQKQQIIIFEVHLNALNMVLKKCIFCLCFFKIYSVVTMTTGLLRLGVFAQAHWLVKTYHSYKGY